MKGKAKRKSQDFELENIIQVENIIDVKVIQICTIYPFLYHVYIL